MRWVLAVACLAAMVRPGWADTESDMRDCASSSGDGQILACSRLIDQRQLRPRNLAQAYFNRGVAYAQNKQFPKAVVDYTQAIKLYPSGAVAYYSRGVARHHLKQYAKAIEDYNEAIRLDPKGSLAYYGRGLSHSRLNQYMRAISAFDKAIELNPGDPPLYHGRGLAYAMMSNNVRAIGDYTSAPSPSSATSAYQYV